ncbi:nitroreductase family protein [Chrysiogenes arsenatis]|uniref:nitroreductase family protein n=1 Tax=Chrysiogenes arsenatis TaxID=309797 RepID=UPI0004017BD8|nr:nitroreductase family protein [Chrysiogenes arsenatis]
MTPREAFTQALAVRHSCKSFEADHEILPDDLRYILEAGRLAPSSFGLEPWQFIVVKSPSKRQELMAACYGQRQIGECAELVAILAKTGKFLDADGAYVSDMFARWGLPQEAYTAVKNMYRNYIAATNAKEWSIAQCHIAAANMMNAAAAIGIDSCAIGGFHPQLVENALEINTDDDYTIAMLLPFGYRSKGQPARHRLLLDDIVTYLH